MSSAIKPPRLTNLPRLKVAPTVAKHRPPCSVEASAVLQCWAQHEQPEAPACAELVEKLTMCMMTRVWQFVNKLISQKPRADKSKNTINYHLGRLRRLL